MNKKEIKNKIKEFVHYNISHYDFDFQDTITDWIFENFVSKDDVKELEEENEYLKKENEELKHKLGTLSTKKVVATTEVFLQEEIIARLEKENEELKKYKEIYDGLPYKMKWIDHLRDIIELKKDNEKLYKRLAEDNHQTPLEWLKEMAEKYPEFKEHLRINRMYFSRADSGYYIVTKSLEDYDLQLGDEIEHFFGGDELVKWLDELVKDDDKEEECKHERHIPESVLDKLISDGKDGVWTKCSKCDELFYFTIIGTFYNPVERIPTIKEEECDHETSHHCSNCGE